MTVTETICIAGAREPLTQARLAVTGFDFTRRDSLGVALKDIPTILKETAESLRQASA